MSCRVVLDELAMRENPLMINRKLRSVSRKTHCSSRVLRHELLESRNLMAGDILDSPTDPNNDTSSGQATGEYPLQTSSETNEVADFVVLVPSL